MGVDTRSRNKATTNETEDASDPSSSLLEFLQLLAFLPPEASVEKQSATSETMFDQPLRLRMS